MPFDVYLGHRRLSILDLSSAGQQPMTDGRGRWITFNGEIFNFIELREELKALGCTFRTETDTEVILHLYDKFGESGFQRMNGMWALAIADLPARRVVLSRDRFSIKPLYLLRNEQAVYFASEIKQLLPLLPQKKANLSVLYAFLSQGLLDHSLETFFCGITRVPPKTNIVIQLPQGTWLESKYWEFASVPAQSPLATQEEFRDLLIDSVRLRLRSDVKVGLLLSGGLDSSSLAVATKCAGTMELESYSVVSDESEFSEEPFIDSVNHSLGLKSIKFRFRLSHIEEMLEKSLDHSGEPFGGLSVVAQYGMFQTIRENSDAKVLLSGQGGDEVLLGYMKFFFLHVQELLRKGRYYAAALQLLSSAIRRTAVRQFRLSEAKRYLPYAQRRNQRILRGSYKPVPVWAGNGVRSRQIADFDLYSVPALAHYEDRNSMAQSMEVRHPFLDHRLVELSLRFPPDCQFKGGWTKSVLRDSFPELPDAVRWRRDKQGFTTPEELWLRRDLTSLIEHTFQRSTLDEMGVVNSKRFLEQYRAYCRGNPWTSFGDISRVFLAETWARQHWRPNDSA